MDRKTGEQTVESGEAEALSCSCSSPGTYCHKTIKDALHAAGQALGIGTKNMKQL